MNKKTKGMPAQYKVMADSIRTGKSNAILLSDIMTIADIKDRRKAYQIIEELINNYGYVIVASREGKYRGYYKPANKNELKEAASTFHNSIRSMNKRYKNLLLNYNRSMIEN